MAYKEAQIMPVAEGVPLAVQFDSLPYAGEAIHKFDDDDVVVCLLRK